MRRFFEWYQYLVPTLLFPVVVYLWKGKVEDKRSLVLILIIPIITSYVIPAIGTNRLKLWEFHTRWLVGGFRFQHGFLFGTFTAFFAYLFIDFHSEISWSGILESGFVLGSILGFWNWVYDIYAIKSGIMTVYTKASTRSSQAEVIAMDYAPVYFGSFGFVYGCELQIIHSYLSSAHWGIFISAGIFMGILAMTIPGLAYIGLSYYRYGESGLKSYKNFEEKR